eukprot:TRINITY_DN1449_c0_g1_i1.p1 TRINITY_DN1449_c0_g1~~TRINITY_DN1449_c0_g1_i1.p1  ORF type:complete len:141 (-),score=47.03 TRINITY_DN1449_c0_g1_i1:54-413(-)
MTKKSRALARRDSYIYKACHDLANKRTEELSAKIYAQISEDLESKAREAKEKAEQEVMKEVNMDEEEEEEEKKKRDAKRKQRIQSAKGGKKPHKVSKIKKGQKSLITEQKRAAKAKRGK